jgi:hypothetical protein
MVNPAQHAYSDLLKAYDFFNKKLFESLLPPIIFTFQRHNGYIAEARLRRWVNGQDVVYDEISINPEYLAKYPLVEIFQSLVFEMATVWQAHYGNPGVAGLVNKEKVLMLERIGLIPSSTGTPSGKKSGHHKNSFVLYDGPFLIVCRELVRDGFKFHLTDRYPRFRPDKPILTYDSNGKPVPITAQCEPISDLSEIKYTCYECGAEVYGKPELNIICIDCEESLLPEYI